MEKKVTGLYAKTITQYRKQDESRKKNLQNPGKDSTKITSPSHPRRRRARQDKYFLFVFARTSHLTPRPRSSKSPHAAHAPRSIALVRARRGGGPGAVLRARKGEQTGGGGGG